MSVKEGHHRWTAAWRDRWTSEPVVSLGAISADPNEDLIVTVMHPAYPGWNFTMTFDPSGTPVGFSVRAARLMRNPSLGSAMRGEPQRFSRRLNPPPLTARWLREVPLGALQDLARERITERLAGSQWPELKGWAGQLTDSPRPGRRGRDDSYFAALAADYAALVARGSRSPIKDLVAQLPGASPSTIRNQLHEARRRGLLTDSAPGHAGGALTPRAIELLNTEDID